MGKRSELPSQDEIRRLPPDGGPDYNRLIHETSPYLLQHAANPVDWYPWGPEAFEKAREENKPVFLSVGYSSCHWCHVMEHESFERADVAEILNLHFVCIKVDREERPDIDDIYMTATQLMTGHGGWPNSLWLLPDGRPWYAGTYFPREDSGGRMGFKTLLNRLAEVWRTRRADIEEQASQLSAAIRQHAGMASAAAGQAPDIASLTTQAVRSLEESYDLRNGGFGSAPKFPPHATLRLLLRLAAPRDGGEANEALLGMIAGTLDAMRRGGIHDHVGGGFHRYSTDERWFLPHFEKMLYDNALLARAYAEAWSATRNEDFRRAARDTLDWVLRDMTGPEGGFYSALDADSEGEEGKFYVWSHSEVMEILGPDEGALLCKVYGIRPDGNFHDEATRRPTGLNIPHLVEEPGDEDRGRLDAALAKLREARARRVWPGLDDKVLAAWNGLMLGSLAHAGRAFDEPRYTEAAVRAAGFLLGRMTVDGKLQRSYRAGKTSGAAYLEDYAALADGLLDLHEATGDARWLQEAERLAARMVELFHDKDNGGFFFTASDHEDLLVRSKDVLDQAMPSGNGLAARVLARLAAATGKAQYADLARGTVAAFATMLRRLPTACSTLLHAADLLDQSGTAPVELPPSSPVAASMSTDQRVVKAGAEFEAQVEIRIADGWHVQANKPSELDLVPTKVSAAGDRFQIVEASYPAGRRAAAGGFDELAVYDGTVTARLRLRAADDLAPGFADITLRVSWQACDDRRCLAPESTEVTATVRVQE